MKGVLLLSRPVFQPCIFVFALYQYRFVFFCPGYQSIRWIHCASLPFLSGMQDSQKGFWKCDYVSIYLPCMDREGSACTLNIFNNRMELFDPDRHEKYISQTIASVWICCSAWDKQKCITVLLEWSRTAAFFLKINTALQHVACQK